MFNNNKGLPYTYKTPSIQYSQNILVSDAITGNLYSYHYTINKGTIKKISGNVWHGTISNSYQPGGYAFMSTYFNSDTNKPFGAYSSAFGCETTTHSYGEVAIGIRNLSHWLYSGDNNQPLDLNNNILFSIGNVSYTDISSTDTTKYSNILTVSRKWHVVSGASYVGWELNENDYSAYLSLIKSTTQSGLYVNGNTYTNNLYLGTDTLPVASAESFKPSVLPTQHPYYPNYKYYSIISYETIQERVNQFNAKYTMDWIDYYEATFRDTICFFGGIIDNAGEDDAEVSVFNTVEANQLWANLNAHTSANYAPIINQSQVFNATVMPVWVKHPWEEGKPGSFQIKINYKIYDGAGESPYNIYLRPCKEAYQFLPPFGQDVDGWFKEHEITINEHTVTTRWSPMTQYQDSDNKDLFGRRSSIYHQLYYNLENCKYYRVDPISKDLVEAFTGSSSSTNLSLA